MKRSLILVVLGCMASWGCLDFSTEGKRFRCPPEAVECQPEAEPTCPSTCEPPAPFCRDTKRITSVRNGCDEAQTCLFSEIEETCSFGCDEGVCLNDSCGDVLCNLPPASSCENPQTLKTYSSQGGCRQGSCSYYFTLVPCEFGCEDGACKTPSCPSEGCHAPPASTCEGSVKKAYASEGSCDAASGQCRYSSVDSVCLHGCQNGDCIAGACEGVSCSSPPPNSCAANSLRTYSSTGQCAAGACEYSYVDTPCPFGCDAGACKTDPCAGIACQTPPASTCVGDALRMYAAEGVCSAGACRYSAVDAPCEFGCENNACKQDPCRQVQCTTPPANACKDANVLRTFAPAGTCAAGQCSYATVETACAFGCNAGQCNADPCAGIICNARPQPVCINANTLRTYPGLCQQGVCSYPSVDMHCPAGCTDDEKCVESRPKLSLVAGMSVETYNIPPLEGRGEAARLGDRFSARSVWSYAAVTNDAVWVAGYGVIQRIDADGNLRVAAGVHGSIDHFDGVGAAARLGSIRALAPAGGESIWFLDELSRNLVTKCLLRKLMPDGTVISVNTGVVGTVDGPVSQALFDCSNVEASSDTAGNTYFYYYDRTIRIISAAGNVTTVKADRWIEAMTVAPSGQAYIASDNAVWQLNLSTGATTLWAGAPGVSQGPAEGPRLSVRFSYFDDLAVDSGGQLWILGGGLRKIDSAGNVTRVVQSGLYIDGPPTVARVSTGKLLADRVRSRMLLVTSAVRTIDPFGNVATLAGGATVNAWHDNQGSKARLNQPSQMAWASPNEILFPDQENQVVRKVTTAGVVTTLSGTPGLRGYGVGNASQTTWTDPVGMVRTAPGIFFVADKTTIRRYENGVSSLFVGLAGQSGGADGFGSEARVAPKAMAVDASGNLLVAESTVLRRVTPQGQVVTVAGLYGSSASLDGTRPNARFVNLEAVCPDPSGVAWVIDNYTVRKVQPDGSVKTILGSRYNDGTLDSGGVGFPVDCLVAPDGTLFVLENRTIKHVDLVRNTVRTIEPKNPGFNTAFNKMLRAPDGGFYLSSRAAIFKLDPP